MPLGEDMLHVYEPSTGQRIVEEESLQGYLNGPFGFWLVFLREHPEWEDDVRFAPEGLEGIKPGELSATPEATKAFMQWAVDQGMARQPERLPGLLDQMNYLTTLERQQRKRRRPKLRLLRPRPDENGATE